MKFGYVQLGVARIVDESGVSRPIEGNYIFGVRLAAGGVLGLVQQHPTLTNVWRAIASARADQFPAVDFNQGLWQMAPGRSEFRTRKEAAVWLLGMHDARQHWAHVGLDEQLGVVTL